MGADFTLVASGFRAAKSVAAEVKPHEVNPPFSVQAGCVWVADFAGRCRNLRREESYFFWFSEFGGLITIGSR
jgi:hypothetical protein